MMNRNNTFKTMLATMMAIAMLLSMTACGGGADSSPTTDQSSSVAESAASEISTEPESPASVPAASTPAASTPAVSTPAENSSAAPAASSASAPDAAKPSSSTPSAPSPASSSSSSDAAPTQPVPSSSAPAESASAPAANTGIQVTKITGIADEITVEQGGSGEFGLCVRTVPENAVDSKPYFKSSDSDIFEVDEFNGQGVGCQPGTAVLTVYTKNGTSKDVTITVTATGAGNSAGLLSSLRKGEDAFEVDLNSERLISVSFASKNHNNLSGTFTIADTSVAEIVRTSTHGYRTIGAASVSVSISGKAIGSTTLTFTAKDGRSLEIPLVVKGNPSQRVINAFNRLNKDLGGDHSCSVNAGEDGSLQEFFGSVICASDSRVRFTSSDPNVVEILGQNLMFKKPGTATLTASLDPCEAYWDITVKDPS